MTTIEQQVDALLRAVENMAATIAALTAQVAALGGNRSGKTPFDPVPGPPVPPGTPPVPPWDPTFEEGHTKNVFGVVYPMSELDFATAETAEEARKRFDAKEVFLHDKFSPNESGQQRWLRWADGLEMNAGRLAAAFDRIPENLFPGAARRQSEHLISQARAARQQP